MDAVEGYLGQQAPDLGGRSTDHHEPRVELAELSEKTGRAFVPRDEFDLAAVPLPHD
jgi:hypothetical protein